MSSHESSFRRRIRCSECGSTRVRGIVLGYVEGRLGLDDDGQVIVEGNDFEPYDEHDIAGGSVVCENCGGGRYRIERAMARA